MIKPEDWARLAVGETDWWRPAPEWEIDFVRLREHVSDAIRAAVEEKQKECAAIADSYADIYHNTARHIAAAIRARGKAA